ncbi:MAG: mechanosensitive ion channel [Leptospiraceae bacterium]|nr:mechanosensitive ion channel [Leptospiraceae bacterium]
MSKNIKFQKLFKQYYSVSFIFCIIFNSSLNAENPLTPLKLDSPRDTVRIFLNAMNEYKKGAQKNDEEKMLAIENAIRCLDLTEINPLIKEEKGKEAAIFLKEAIDRVYVAELSKIPGPIVLKEGEVHLSKWYIPDTEISITRIPTGAREGEYLFSANTVANAGEYYRRTKHLPFLAKTGGGAAYSLPWMETVFPNWAKEKFWLFYIWQWLGLVISLIISFILRYLSRFVFYILMKITRKTKTDWDERVVTTLARPTGYFIGLIYWFSFLHLSGMEGKPFTFFNYSLKILFSINFIYFVFKISDLVVAILKDNSIREKNPIDEQLIPLISKSLRILFVTFGVLIAVQNLGINVMGLIAGLGIGGLAIALAAKDTAANLFGSAMIFMDRPFKIGEHIIIDSKEGIVEDIGFRSTRIRTWEDSLVSIPNSVVANANIENMGARRWRRNVVILSVTYDTSPEKMEAFLEGIKYILKRSPLVVPDTMNVAFRDFDSSSLNVLMQFGLEVDSFPKNLEGRQVIFLEVVRLAKEMDISFAFPTSTLHVESFPEKKPTRVPKERSIPKYKEAASGFAGGGKSAKEGAGIFTAPYRELPEKDPNTKNKF